MTKRRGKWMGVAGAAVTLAVAMLAMAPGAGAQAPGTPGDVELFNLEHVFNFNPEGHDPGRDSFVGSDLEFFAHTVPLRDYETGQLLAANGNPLPEGAEPVLAKRDFAVMGSYQRGGYVFDITDPENTQFVTRVTCRQPRNDVAIKKFTDPDTGETRVVLGLTQQSGNPCGVGDEEVDEAVGVRVNPDHDLAGFYEATSHWTGTPEPNDETADLVYAGTGCTDAQYVVVDVAGKIALIDAFENADGVPDCPTFTFKQKMDAAERAGAIGVVQVDDDDEPFAGNAFESGIPGMEISNTDGAPIRDAVIDSEEEGGEPVNATLTKETQGEVPNFPLRGTGSGGVGFFDITDPFDWKPLYAFRTGLGGVHNFIFHPTKPFGYVSNGALPGAIDQIPIIDFTDLEDPRLITGVAQTEGGVHDIEFSIDGDRAYAASESNYRIYDTTDPANPELISRTPNVGTYAHGVFPSSDLELMVTNNESLALGGFFVGGTGVCPGEGLASYDITDEGAPIGPLAYYTPNVVGRTDARPCTSHFGRFAPDTKILSMGWYIAGVRIVDWSNPADPEEVAGAVLEGTNTWAAKFHKGPYVYAGDVGRGFDVFRWSGEGDAPWVTEEPSQPTLGVEVTCDNCPLEIRAGETGDAELTVTNTGDAEDTYQITVEGLPDGWSATVNPGEVTVEPGEDAAVAVTIDVPQKERKGTHTLSVTVTSSTDDEVEATEEVEVAVRKGRPSDSGPPR